MQVSGGSPSPGPGLWHGSASRQVGGVSPGPGLSLVLVGAVLAIAFFMMDHLSVV